MLDEMSVNGGIREDEKVDTEYVSSLGTRSERDDDGSIAIDEPAAKP